MIDTDQLDEQIKQWGTSFLGFHADMQPDFERAILGAFSGLLPDVPDHTSPIAQALLYRFLSDPQLVHFDEHVLWEGLSIFDKAIASDQKSVKSLLDKYRQQFWTAMISLMRLALWWPTVKYSVGNREDFIFRHLAPHYVLTFESVYAPLITMTANWSRISRKKKISYTSVNNAMQDLRGHDILLKEGPWQIYNSDDANSKLKSEGFRRIIRNSMAHADFYIYDETPFPEFMVFPRLGEKNSNDEPFFYDEQAISIYEELLDDCSSLALCLLFAEEKLGLLDSQQELSTQLSRRSMESKLHVILRCVLEPSGTMVKRAWSQRLNKIDTFYAELESGSSSYQTEIALKRANECGRALIQGDGFCASIESGTQAGEWATGMIESGDHLTKPDGMIFSQEKPGMAKKAVQEHWDGLRVHWEEHLTQLQGLKSHFNWPLAHKTPATHLDRSLKLDDTFQIVNAKGWPANEVKEVEFAIICPKAIERASLRKQIRDLVYTLRQLEVTFPNPHSHRHWKGKPAGMVTACFYMRRPREDVLISGRCSERKCAIAKIEWHNQGNCPYWIKPSESLPNKELPGPIHVEWSPRWESA